MKYKLGEVCRFYSGTGFPIVYQGLTDEELPFYKVGDIANNVARGKTYLELCNNYISRETAAEIRGAILPKDTVVFAKIGEALKLNRRAITSSDCLIDNNAMGIAPKSDYLRTRYFFFFMKQLKMQDYAESTTVPSVRKSKLEEIEINVPSFDEQAKIETLLDRVSKVVLMRQEELQKLDELIKARFVEMFGDVKTNEYDWEKCTFGDVTTKITDGEHGTVPRVEKADGRLYFMARNITKDGEIDLSETSYVPEDVHQKIYKRCNPEPNDILLVCVGATIGKSTLVPEYLGEFSMARSVALLKPNSEKVNSTFLINLLKSDAVQNDIANCAHAAAQAGLYTNMIKSLDAYLPPMELQTQFSEFVKQLDKSKVAVQEALDEAQLLFDSLMQKCFR